VACAPVPEVIEVEGVTGNINTNFDGKAKATLETLLGGNDFCYIHLEAPDECGHQGQAKEKARSIELINTKIVKYVKSNGIALGKNKQSIGIGPGQVNRIWATKQAIEHANELIGSNVTKGAVMASDAFFPFSDCVEEAHKAGITAIIQPGGSIKDQESIDKCNEYGIAMLFTEMRHFRH
jgi:AICAR transformylase/IMP cyclohydrolase PurH